MINISINSNSFSPSSIEIKDFAGNLVYQSVNTLSFNSIDTSYLRSGIYFVEVKNIESHIITKILRR